MIEVIEEKNDDEGKRQGRFNTTTSPKKVKEKSAFHEQRNRMKNSMKPVRKETDKGPRKGKEGSQREYPGIKGGGNKTVFEGKGERTRKKDKEGIEKKSLCQGGKRL